MIQINNFLIKREQSQARLSFAKREKSRLLAKTILTLVALLAVTTGAWATDETLLTTITPTGDGTYSETTAGAVTVTPAGSFFYSGSSYGWRWDGYGSLTVTANEGYTITGCVFIQQGKNQSVTISEAPFALNFEEWLCLENTSMDGVTSIEVYGTAPSASSASGPKVAWDKAKKTGTFTMPGGNVTLEPEYYPQAALTAAPTAINDVPATTDGAIVKAGTVANIGSTETAQGTVMYYVSQTALDDAALLALAADKWTADVPTAEKLTKGEAYVYYYVRGNDSDNDEENFSDGDILAANALTVNIAAEPTYAVTFAEGVNPEPPAEPEWTASPNTGVKKGTPVTVTYTGSKKVIGVKAEKKAADPTVTLTPGEIGDLTSSSKTINGITIAVSGDAHFRTTGLMDVTAFDGETGDPIPSTGTFTFTSSVGKIKRIDINHNGGKWWGSGDGWPGSYQVWDTSTFTWSGTPAASVTLNGSCNDTDNCTFDVSSIVFTLEPTN